MIAQVHQYMLELSISQLCGLLHVSCSWYYENQTPEDEVNVELSDAIEQIILDFAGFGYRSITDTLKRVGQIVHQK